jgi:uncharacterized protein YpmB
MRKGKSRGSVKPGRKKLYSLIVGIVLIILVVAFAGYYITSRTSIVKIIQFNRTGDAQIPDQVLYRFSVTIENQGIDDISSLVLRVRVLGDGVELGSDTHTRATLLHGQKWTPDEVAVWVSLTDIGGKIISFSAALDLGNRTIDEVTIS